MHFRTPSLVVASLFIGIVASGCSSSSSSGGANPTLDSAGSQIGQALCERWETCSATAFAASFPNGINDCISLLKTSIQNASNRKPTDPANCSESVIQACDSDIGKVDCAEFGPGGTLQLPDTCKGKC